MSTPWRIALCVALVLLGIGGGMCALRTAKMIQRQVKEQEVEPDGAEPEAEDEASGDRE